MSWVFSIELHKDDIGVLEYIRSNLGYGNIKLNKDKCVFRIASLEGTNYLISIFDKYNLNSTKYLDYLNYKKSIMLYQKIKESRISYNMVESENFTSKILELKNTMNTKRTNTILPAPSGGGHEIVITKN